MNASADCFPPGAPSCAWARYRARVVVRLWTASAATVQASSRSRVTARVSRQEGAIERPSLKASGLFTQSVEIPDSRAASPHLADTERDPQDKHRREDGGVMMRSIRTHDAGSDRAKRPLSFTAG